MIRKTGVALVAALAVMMAVGTAGVVAPAAARGVSRALEPVVYLASRLTPAGAGVDDLFGWSVAVSGTTAVVGAPGRGISGVFKGSVFVFTRAGEGWQQEAELSAADGENADGFGGAVAISGDTIVVGAPGTDPGGRPGAGAAYVFVRAAGVWRQQAKLSAAEQDRDDGFGLAVAISRDTIVVGAPFHDFGEQLRDAGSAYVFTRSESTWTERFELDGGVAPQAGAAFGYAVAIGEGAADADSTVAVGAPFFSRATGAQQGRASVFVGHEASWVKQADLEPDDPGDGDAFGLALGISGDLVVVGAPGHDPGGKPVGGQAYAYIRNGAAWNRQATLSAGDGTAGDQFGSAVAVSGNTAIVGAPFHAIDAGAGSPTGGAGQAYVLVLGETGWREQAALQATDAAREQFFGFAVAIDGGATAVGAPFHDGTVAPDADAGPAYVFTPTRLAGRIWVGL